MDPVSAIAKTAAVAKVTVAAAATAAVTPNAAPFVCHLAVTAPFPSGAELAQRTRWCSPYTPPGTRRAWFEPRPELGHPPTRIPEVFDNVVAINLLIRVTWGFLRLEGGREGLTRALLITRGRWGVQETGVVERLVHSRFRP